MNIITCDVLVVGGGLAGASTVKNLLEKSGDLKVCQAVKGRYGVLSQRGCGASSCGASESGAPYFIKGLETDELLERWHNRIIQAGLGLADRQLTSVMIEEAPKVKALLQKWGIVFGGEGPRHLGYPFVHTVEREIRSSRVQLFEDTIVTDILTDGGQCVGAIAITGSEEVVLFHTPAVVLATGGNAQLFRDNVHPSCVTGDGYAVGFRAGAELMNMEFMQIFFSTVYPSRNLFHARDKKVLEQVYNADNHHFLADYLPADISPHACIEENLLHAPFSTRDKASRYLAIGIVKEIQAGRGTEHGGVFFDVTSSMDGVPDLQDRFFRGKGIELAKTPIQVTMAHQCSNGGLRVDRNAMTTVAGLFAAGETSTGMHGADRLGGHMLLSCLVYGKRAADAAARWAKANPVGGDIRRVARRQLDELQAIIASTGTTAPAELLHKLKNSAWNHGLTIRSEQSLTTLLADIHELRDEFHANLSLENPGALVTAVELKNLLLVGELVATAAKLRRESRGGHYREDYPEINKHDPVKAILLNAAEGEKIGVNIEAIDPDWSDNEDKLGAGRWG